MASTTMQNNFTSSEIENQQQYLSSSSSSSSSCSSSSNDNNNDNNNNNRLCRIPEVIIEDNEVLDETQPPKYTPSHHRSSSLDSVLIHEEMEIEGTCMEHKNQVKHISLNELPPTSLSFVAGNSAQSYRSSSDHSSSSTDDDENVVRHVSIPMDYGTDDLKSALLKDQRYSIQMRSQAYASMAVVAALIAGISITFIVEVKFEFDGETTSLEMDRQQIVYKCCAMGSLLVCFLSLYATMVLSMQYYLITRALGHVSTVSLEAEEATLDDISLFMKKTLFTRHLAVKSVVASVPLFAIIMAAFGVAKAGLGPIGYTSLGMGVIASAFFIHAVVVQHMAFVQRPVKAVIRSLSTDVESKMQRKSSKLLFDTTDSQSTPTSSTPRSSKQWAAHDQTRKLAAASMLKKASNQASNFRLVW